MTVHAHAGVVDIHGAARAEPIRRAAIAAAEGVAGVKRVRSDVTIPSDALRS